MRQKPIDALMFASLVALLDAAEGHEAEGALYRIREALKKAGKRFYEVVETSEYKSAAWEAFGQPECLKPRAVVDTASLEAELSRERQRRLEAAQDYAEGLRKCADANEALRSKIAELEASHRSRPAGVASEDSAVSRRAWWQVIVAAAAIAYAITALLH
ncbi:MAG TPA: hypothetical protein VGN17_02165 [Bryobacteraceae bacterium]